MKKTKGYKKPVARQLPSGSWFCRVRVDGKDISVTKDTQAEAEAAAMAVKYGIIESRATPKGRKTLKEALRDYVDARKGYASPSTIYAYEGYIENCFQSMMYVNIFKATDEQWQAAIKREAAGKSPKYLSNVWSMVASAIQEATGQRPKVKLPAEEKAERPFLEPEQIETFVKAIKGDPAEIAALLELSSLRRSEMLAVRWKDVDFAKGIIHIRGARVRSTDGLIHKNQNKTKASTRVIPIIPPLLEALQAEERRGEYVVTAASSTIYRRINAVCKANALPEVGNHGLRHSFASLAYHLQIPEKIAMEIGGWSDDGTMRKIYTHLAQKDIAARAQDFSNFFAPKPTPPANTTPPANNTPSTNITPNTSNTPNANEPQNGNENGNSKNKPL